MLISYRLQQLISRNGRADGHLSPIRIARVSEETKVHFLIIHLNHLVDLGQASLVEETQVELRQKEHLALLSHHNHRKNPKVHSLPSRVKESLLALVTSRAHLDQEPHLLPRQQQLGPNLQFHQS